MKYIVANVMYAVSGDDAQANAEATPLTPAYTHGGKNPLAGKFARLKLASNAVTLDTNLGIFSGAERFARQLLNVQKAGLEAYISTHTDAESEESQIELMTGYFVAMLTPPLRKSEKKEKKGEKRWK